MGWTVKEEEEDDDDDDDDAFYNVKVAIVMFRG